jgi:hypothetical protein
MIAMRRNQVQSNRVYEPTAKDIRRACERIQSTWSNRERARRAGQPRSARWTPPNIHMDGILEAVQDDRPDVPSYIRGLTCDDR